MKLLIVSPQPEHPPVDAFRVFRALGEELSRRGHTVDYFIEPGKIKPIDASTENPATGTGSLGRGLKLATHLTGVCRQRGYDFILTAASLGWCLSTWRQWLLPSQTKILSWHGGHTALKGDAHSELEANKNSSQRHSTNWKERLGHWVTKKALETQDGYFFNATEAPVRVLKEHPDTAQQKLLYLPSGVANSYYFPERHHRADGQHQPSRLLMVGPWAEHNKNLIESFVRLHQNHPHLCLTIGKPGINPEQLLAAFPSQVQPAIRVMPNLNEAELIKAYQQHDIYLQPTPIEGGVPLSLLEAMAAAMPVVADEAPGVRDVLQHYENGLLIPPRDGNALEQSITHLLESPDLYRNLGETAYDYVSRYYTWRQVSDIFEEKLFQILENRLINHFGGD